MKLEREALLRDPKPDLRPDDVREIRYKLGQSQSEFASMIGVSVPTLQSWEEGKAEARADDVLTVLDVRGIAVPEAARARILAEKDMKQLKRWLQKAAVASSIADVIDETK